MQVFCFVSVWLKFPGGSKGMGQLQVRADGLTKASMMVCHQQSPWMRLTDFLIYFMVRFKAQTSTPYNLLASAFITTLALCAWHLTTFCT